MKSFVRKAATSILALGASLSIVAAPVQAQQPLLTVSPPPAVVVAIVATAPEDVDGVVANVVPSPAAAPSETTPPVVQETNPAAEIDSLRQEIRGYKEEVRELRALVEEQNKLLRAALPALPKRTTGAALANGPILDDSTTVRVKPARQIRIKPAPVVAPPSGVHPPPTVPVPASTTNPPRIPRQPASYVPTQQEYAAVAAAQEARLEWEVKEFKELWKEVRRIKAQPLGGGANQKVFLEWMREMKGQGKLVGIVDKPMGKKEVAAVVNTTIDRLRQQGLLAVASATTSDTTVKAEPSATAKIGGRAIIALIIIFAIICSLLFYLLNPNPQPVLKEPKGKTAEFWEQMKTPTARFQAAAVGAFVLLIVLMGIGWPMFKP